MVCDSIAQNSSPCICSFFNQTQTIIKELSLRIERFVHFLNPYHSQIALAIIYYHSNLPLVALLLLVVPSRGLNLHLDTVEFQIEVKQSLGML